MSDLIERQAAIDALSGLQVKKHMPKETQVTLESAKAILRLLQPAQPEQRSAYEDGYEKGYNDGFEVGQHDIQPERKPGKWEPIVIFDGYVDFSCSACHRYRFHNGEMRKKYKYCPNCGADMRGELNER